VVGGLWIVTLICALVGVAWCSVAEHYFIQLGNLPLDAWRLDAPVAAAQNHDYDDGDTD